jgi:hypothetical protein
VHSKPNFAANLSESRLWAGNRLRAEPASLIKDWQLAVLRKCLKKERQEKARAKKKKQDLVIISFFKAPRYRLCFRVFFFIWVASFVLLGVLGAKPVEYPYSELSALATGYYFCFFLFLI